MRQDATVDEIRAELVRILKRATKVSAPVTVVSGVGLDWEVTTALDQLVRHLSHHPRFEQNTKKTSEKR
jgi:hypothetical protein